MDSASSGVRFDERAAFKKLERATSVSLLSLRQRCMWIVAALILAVTAPIALSAATGGGLTVDFAGDSHEFWNGKILVPFADAPRSSGESSFENEEEDGSEYELSDGSFSRSVRSGDQFSVGPSSMAPPGRLLALHLLYEVYLI